MGAASVQRRLICLYRLHFTRVKRALDGTLDGKERRWRVVLRCILTVRHTKSLLVSDGDLRKLWDEHRIAVHYPGDTECGPDLRSTNAADYEGRGKTAMRYFRDLEENGGYVWAESRVSPGTAMVGRVKAGTKIELYEGTWYVEGSVPGRKTGDPAILKTLRLEKGSVRFIDRTEHVGLRAGRPRQGTISRWKCGTRLEDLVEGRDTKQQWPNLSTEQQETACAEFLRLQQKRDDLPRLRYLLLPVGRTLKDVDVYALAEDNQRIFVQVTYHSGDSNSFKEKVSRLKAYGKDGAHLVFFGQGDGPLEDDGIKFVSVQSEVMDWIRNEPPDYRSALFGS